MGWKITTIALLMFRVGRLYCLSSHLVLEFMNDLPHFRFHSCFNNSLDDKNKILVCSLLSHHLIINLTALFIIIRLILFCILTHLYFIGKDGEFIHSVEATITVYLVPHAFKQFQLLLKVRIRPEEN